MNLLWPRILTIITSALPVIELRGGIPLGRALGLPTWEAFLFAVIGTMAPIFLLLYILGPITTFLRNRSLLLDRFFGNLFKKTQEKHSKNFERFGAIALVTFIAIPLPGTGAWTGSLIAFVFGIPYKTALFLIALGVIASGLLMTAGVESTIHLINLFR